MITQESKTPSLSGWVRRHEYLARAGLFATVALIVVVSLVVPSWRKSGELNKKIVTRQKEETELTDKVRVLSGLNIELLNTRLEVLDKALPPRKDVVLYLSAVDGLSRELGLSFAGISLSPGDVTEASESAQVKTTKTDLVAGVHVLETEVKINGDKAQIYQFLRTLENSMPLMQVKDVKMSPLGLGESESYSLAVKLGMLWAGKDVNQVKGQVTLFNDKEEQYFSQLMGLRSYNSLDFAEIGNLTEGLGKTDLFEPKLTTPQPTESPQTQPEVGQTL